MLLGVERANRQLPDQPEVRADLLHAMGNILRAFADSDKPVTILESAIELRNLISAAQWSCMMSFTQTLGHRRR